MNPQNSGKEFESEILVTTQSYRDKGIACFHHPDTGTTFRTGKEGKAEMYYTRRAGVDFIGVGHMTMPAERAERFFPRRKSTMRLASSVEKIMVEDIEIIKEMEHDLREIVRSSPIAFDAKSCMKSTFPLANVKDHQARFLKSYKTAGGLGFFLINMTHYEAVWLLDVDDFEDFKKHNLMASIPREFFMAKGLKAKRGNGLELVDFLNPVMPSELEQKVGQEWVTKNYG